LAADVIPVCGPSLLNGELPLHTPADLAHHTLLHVGDTFSREDVPAWGMWLKAAGLHHVDARRGPKFSSESLVAEAAAAGQGVALLEAPIISADLASGRLVRLFCDLPYTSSGFSYYFVCPPERLGARKVRALRDWVVAEAERFRSQEGGRSAPAA
jgi:LysR family glycine cleavage system transcriptional activator